MKNLIKFVITLALILLFVQCNEDNLITNTETANIEKSTLEKGVIASASGHGDVHYEVGGTSIYQRFSFNAKNKDGEIHGILNYYDDEVNLKFKGEVTCLTIDGNIAIMAGKIIKYSWDNNYEIEPELSYFWLKVVDNGEGSNCAPDQTSLVFAPIPEYPCDNWPVPLYDIENGNIQVKP